MNLQKGSGLGGLRFFFFFFDQALTQDNAFSWLRKRGGDCQRRGGREREEGGEEKRGRDKKKRMGCRAASLNWSDDREIRRGFQGGMLQR